MWWKNCFSNQHDWRQSAAALIFMYPIVNVATEPVIVSASVESAKVMTGYYYHGYMWLLKRWPTNSKCFIFTYTRNTTAFCPSVNEFKVEINGKLWSCAVVCHGGVAITIIPNKLLPQQWTSFCFNTYLQEHFFTMYQTFICKNTSLLCSKHFCQIDIK